MHLASKLLIIIYKIIKKLIDSNLIFIDTKKKHILNLNKSFFIGFINKMNKFRLIDLRHQQFFLIIKLKLLRISFKC